MDRRTPTLEIALVAALLASAVPTYAGGSAARLSGGIAGEVKSASGVVQMGATVILYNRYDRAISQILTDAKGAFQFDSLLPDVYSLRVSLASFYPAFKKNIQVQPGFQSILTINMATMFSSIDILPAKPIDGELISSDWKWVLRSSPSTRPILRFDTLDLGSPSSNRPRFASAFSETRGMVNVSAGDAMSFSGGGALPDMGTAFALVTSLAGSNQLQVSGNVGYSHSGLPTAGFRTTFSRGGTLGETPEVTITMRQIGLPAHGGFGPAAQDSSLALRTMEISTINEFDVSENLRLEYGASAESVSMLDRLNRISPFARLTYDLGSSGSVQFAYSSGADAMELMAHGFETGNREDTTLSQDLTALGQLPALSMRNGHVRVQSNDDLELGYKKVQGSRIYSAGVYREHISDAALMMAGGDGMFSGADLLPDFGSNASVFNVGRFDRWGYLASVTQTLGDRVEVMVGYGRGGALSADQHTMVAGTADELRSLIKMDDKNWAMARVTDTVPRTGTHFSASYGWADYRSLMPGRLFLTQPVGPQPGLNISVRQPMPSFGMPGRFEACAELRNLLAQGYIPFSTSDGRTIVLTNAPRAVRGGLSFIF